MITPDRQLIRVNTTLPDRESAYDLLESLLEKRLVACGHIHEIRSSFRWNGPVQSNDEFLLSLKTRVGLFNDVERHIAQNHPYELPMIVACDITRANAAYVDWVYEETTVGA